MLQLLKRMVLFSVHLVFLRKVYILRAQNLKNSLKLDKADFKPDIENITFKVISTNEEADELEANGFQFRSYPTTWNVNLEVYRTRLDQGLIAFCAYVGHELAAVTWIVPSQEVHDRLDTIPQKVNYSNGEVWSRGAWVHPKFRGRGLYKYNVLFNRDPFLVEKGITVLRTASSEKNKIAQRMLAGVGAKPYAKGYYMKILWWKFLRETPFDRDNRKNYIPV